jgi:hypothetical protein
MDPSIQRLPASPAAVLAALRRAPLSASRDPRTAPLSLRKNISIVETCRFYGAADALTSCRVPRSCQDCLAMPVSLSLYYSCILPATAKLSAMS